MLQQTTVKAVVPYFERFIARFPTIETLASASEEEVLRYWEGLGYYSRGRNLRRAAIRINEAFSGAMPESLNDLQSLPGIGRYTAGAIMSFAFNQPAPILEANTLRLYARLLGYAEDPRNVAGQHLLWSFASLLPTGTQSGQVNQALMELGSLVCTPRDPSCSRCPLNEFCIAFRNGQQTHIPLLAKRPEITPLVEACVAVQRDGRWLLRRREDTERWAGLWDFPRGPVDSIRYSQRLTQSLRAAVATELEHQLAADWQMTAQLTTHEMQIRHSVTRYRIRLLCFQATWLHGNPTQGTTRWATPEEITELPLTVTARQVARWVSNGE